jgi:PhnB protein
MNGRAREAVAFYEKALEAQVMHVRTYGEMPVPCPDALKDCVCDSLLRVGESVFMLFDAPHPPVPGSSADPDSGLSAKAAVALSITIRDAEKTRRIFGALQQGGTVIAPLEEVPFSPAFGTVTDQFGVTFILMAQPANG